MHDTSSPYSDSRKNFWPRESVVYHIYPRSFKDSNGDGVGDLRGIIEKLDYFNDGTARSLGVNAIWISPFFPSPMADFGYDISDYCNVDQMFGTLADFDELLDEAHKRGIKVIVDFVPNHTSREHPWFREARASRENPKRDWYIWKDPKPETRLSENGHGAPPSNWLSVFGGSAWEYDALTRQYYLHSFVKEQPDLNWENAEVREAMKNVLRFWFHRGVDGVRVDAIEFLAKDPQCRDELPNPNYQEGAMDPYDAFLHRFSKNYSNLFSYVRAMEEVIGEYPNRFMVTEAYAEIRESVEDYARFYRNCKTGKVAPFNFELIYLPWDAQRYRRFIDAFQSALEPADIPVYVLGNHDRHRAATRMGCTQSRVAALLLLTLPGMPFVYYGEELGMEDGDIPLERVQDPFEKNVPGMGFGRDPVRTPMQWTAGLHAGFSQVAPWLPVASRYKERNAETEAADPRSMFSLYRALIHYRINSEALTAGTYASRDAGNNAVCAYERAHGNKKIIVALNFSEHGQRITLNFRNARLACTTYLDRATGTAADLTKFSLRPHEGCVFEVSR